MCDGWLRLCLFRQRHIACSLSSQFVLSMLFVLDSLAAGEFDFESENRIWCPQFTRPTSARTLNSLRFRLVRGVCRKISERRDSSAGTIRGAGVGAEGAKQVREYTTLQDFAPSCAACR